MIPGMRGSLLSHDALESAGLSMSEDLDVQRLARQLATWHASLAGEAGPVWTARMVFDRIAAPFCRSFGLEALITGGDARAVRGLLRLGHDTTGVVIAMPWGTDPAAGWRESVRTGIGASARWCFCFTGPHLRVFDAERTHSRRHVEFEIAALVRHPETLATAWSLFGNARAGAIDAAVRLSEQHRVSVRQSMQSGVHEALGHLVTAFASASGRRRRSATEGSRLLDESLVVIYRVLFLLFAEARGLVPTWHVVYRDSYTVDALRAPVERHVRPPGVWEALQAMARLAHRGCRAGSLRVPPFNGRLFSPRHAPLADAVPLDDGAVREALLVLTTRVTESGRKRIAFADLGVEHLGGVYERVLDYELQRSDGKLQLIRGGRRKATGTFYTPRSVTEYLVRRTLAPLVEDAGPDEILALRIVDPAMGSGAFLVAACRYLATAYEAALVRAGVISPGDVDESARAAFRRLVAQRTLFGVDQNPMAVQLARLSLWLATLSADRPLTFFDHHLRSGNSLAGASMVDVTRRLPARVRAASALPLLDGLPFEAVMQPAVSSRIQLRDGREDTLEQVRAKEALLERILAPDAPLSTWKAVADLWCASWFDPALRSPGPAAFVALVDGLLNRHASLPRQTARGLLERGRGVAGRERFFHWELEFPEVFHGSDGAPLATPGFDAVLGNPPWEMLRGDRGGNDEGARLTRFARDSGIYRLQGKGHANLYQLFVERSIAILRDGGRLGLVLPSGIASDHGCGRLRRHLFDETTIDSFVVADNREAIFPIHRGLKFVVMTLTRSRNGTAALPLRSGIRSAADFDRLPDSGSDPEALPVTRRVMEQISGEQLAIPDFHSPLDLEIAGRLSLALPAAGSASGWNLRFGRELNATDDRCHFNDRRSGLPVVEGKQLLPFAVDLSASRHFITIDRARRLLPTRPFDRARVAYRDVASSTNRLTLIAAVLPAGTVTTHTVFCLRTPLDDDAQHVVAGLMNSFVANYLVRLRVTMHVTVAIVERLPLPCPARGTREFARLVELARQLANDPDDTEAMAALQAAAASEYGLKADEFDHVLATFPLVDDTVREAARQAFLRTI